MTNSSAGQAPDQADCLRAVIDAWLKDHHGEPVRLQRTDVHEIAYRLIEAHLHPTVDQVRQVNGGKGSPNVIHPALRDFFMSGELERRWNAPRAAEGVPEPLVSLWSELLDLARQDVRREFKDDAEKANAAKVALVDQAQELDARERTINERIEAQDALVRHLENEADSAKNDAAQAKQVCERERTDAKAQINAAIAARDAAQRVRYDQQNIIVGLEQKLAVLATEREVSTKAALEQLQRSNSRCDDALQRLREAERGHRTETAALNEIHGEALSQLQSSLDTAREFVAVVMAERDTSKAELARADAALAACAEQVKSLRETLGSREAKIEALEVSLHKVLRHITKNKRK